jgi:hypothetical protein
MTPDRQEPPGNVDSGTQLGAGTRLLASLFRLPVRAARAIGRMGRRGWVIVAIVALLIVVVMTAITAGPAATASGAGFVVLTVFALAAVVFVPAIVIVGIAKGAPYVGRVIARTTRFVWPPLRAMFRGIGHALALVGRPISRAIELVVLHVGRAIASVESGIGRAVRAIAVPVGHALTRAARTTGHAIRAIAVPIGHALARTARTTGHAISRATAAVGHAIRAIAVPIGRALTQAARATGRGVAFMAVHIGHAIRAITVPIGHALARTARTTGRAIGAAFRAVGRLVVAILAPVARGIVRAESAVRHVVLTPSIGVLSAVGAALDGALGRMTDRIAAFVVVCTRWVTTHVFRVRHSIGVAAARARQSSASAATTSAGAELPRVAVPPPPFTAEVFHNEYLPAGGRDVDAVITVTALAGPDDGDDRVATAEVILVDCSGSMGHPWRKIRAARAATVAAIDALPDGAYFAIVRANHDADVVYPTHGGLAIKHAGTAADARRAVAGLWPEGGTAMGRWLLAARDLLSTTPHAIGHAILLTDGKNESESPEALATARRACRGRFQCDCRGVGTDWDVGELRGIADELLGTVDIVADPSDLADDFRSMAERAAAKRVDGVTLRVWTPAESTVRFIKQVSPTIEDLDVRTVRVDARTVDYPTGAWSDESRDYHLSIELPEKPEGTEMLAARVSLVVGDRVLSKALVTATWTEDLELSTRIVAEVVHYTGQAELLSAVQHALAARRAGDETSALARLGEATRLAYEAGNEATLQLLAQVVEIDDAPTGQVRARATVHDADVIALETRSTRTLRFAVPTEPVHTGSSVSSD